MNKLLIEKDEHAWALALFVKRVTWAEIRDCAVDDDEARVIREALEELQQSLAEAGFTPR